MFKSDYWIKNLGLRKHPEGGFFAETFRSAETIPASALPPRYSGDRVISTAIYFMVTSESPSKFHRIKSDEFWLYHTGGKLSISMLLEDGTLEKKIFGLDVGSGETPQLLIPGDTWFAACIEDGDYVLLSCTVSPGFDFNDFELASRESLLEKFPQHEDTIIELT
jgi:uncharacterized protein